MQIGSSALFFLPTVYPVTLDNMNWTAVVVVGTMALAAINWFTTAHRNYRGPTIVSADEADTVTDAPWSGRDSHLVCCTATTELPARAASSAGYSVGKATAAAAIPVLPASDTAAEDLGAQC